MRVFVTVLLSGAAWLAPWGSWSHAAQLPALPQLLIDTSYFAPYGNRIVVKAGDDLQRAIDRAEPGDMIVVQAGATFTGPFTLPDKTRGFGWIYIQSSAYASLPPPGSRITAADAAHMPRITVRASGRSAIETKANAHHYRFVGIEFAPAPGTFIYNLVSVGTGGRSAADLPHDITFDRCYIHGDPVAGGRRGVIMDGVRVAVIDSRVADFKESGADSQAVLAYNTPGPLKVANNYLEASGENLMLGGADPQIPDALPSDVEIRRNHFFKPLAWMGSKWTVKNLLELKLGRRVLVEGNVFENNWLAAQDGEAIVITPRNQDGGAPWSATQDITIRSNRILNVGKGINIAGIDDDYRSQRTRRVLIENNVIDVTGLGKATARIFQFVSGPDNVTVRHNTGFTIARGASVMAALTPKTDQFDFRDNLLSLGSYGFFGDAVGEGSAALAAYFSNYSFRGNAVIGGATRNYPADNFFPADTAAVRFLDYGGRDYRLSAFSPFKNAGTDGKDIGADIDAIEEAIAGSRPRRLAAPDLRSAH
jgi:hypothetical protein